MERRTMEQSWQQNNEYECMKYSVLMPVYHKENPAYFYQAAASMMNQTIPPDEFVLVCDGPLTPVLDETIQTIDREWPGVLQVLRLPVCGGIARALAAGVEACRNEWIARMDSDDIACPDRCEKQLKRYAEEAAGKLLGKKAEQGKLGLLSGKIAEFAAAEVPEQENVDNLNAPDRGEIGSGMNGKLFPPGRITGIRSLPCQYKEILTFARKRNPMNHMAVMMRRSAVLAVGNYHPVPGAEDYELWDIRHFSFSLLFIIYICIALCTGHYIVPEEQSLFSPLLIWFLCLIYILIMLPVRLNKIYKRSIAGQTWVEITPEGLTYDKAKLKQTFPWEEIAGIALYKTYCFLYDKRGGEFLIVTSDEKVKESLLYYLNTKK